MRLKYFLPLMFLGLLFWTAGPRTKVEGAASNAGGIIRLANRTRSNVTMSVDGSYACTALAVDQYNPERTCQVSASVGHHSLLATNADGASARDACDLPEGGTFVWTISE